MYKKNKYLLLLPLLIFSAIWIYLQTDVYKVDMSSDFETSVFTDKETDKGLSTILSNTYKNGITNISFELNEGFISPYAGVSFTPKTTYFDIDRYGLIEVEIETQNTKNLELAISTFQENVTKVDDPLSYRHNTIQIPLNDKTKTYTLEKDRITIAQWWLERYKLQSAELKSANWTKCKSISFIAKIRLDNTKPQALLIKNMIFRHDLTMFTILGIIGLVIFYVAILFLYYWNKKEIKTPIVQKSKIIVEYKQTETNHDNEISEYITTHYTSPDLSLTSIANKTGYSEKEISKFIKQEFDMNFKEYLNGIRINEAKRLLKESSENISNIAFVVGFNSPNHFNRTFKNMESVTPTDFRKNCSDSNI